MDQHEEDVPKLKQQLRDSARELSQCQSENQSLKYAIIGLQSALAKKEDSILTLNAKASEVLENTVKQLQLQHSKTINTHKLMLAVEKTTSNKKLEKKQQLLDALTLDLNELRCKASKGFISSSMLFTGTMNINEESKDYRRPLKDNWCQTTVTDDGLWDQQDGWVMPISRTAVVRAQWRRCLQFAVCSSCRGIGNYVHKVGALLRKIKRGSDVIREEIISEELSRWSLPDEIVIFLSNLPKTVQTFRPHSLIWTMRCVYYLFALKHAADKGDDALNYERQSLSDFVIERYLISTEQRAEAELRFYRLLSSLREHYRSHALLHLFVRCMGILDAVSDDEAAAILRQQSLGEAALQRKREAELASMSYRERTKHLMRLRQQQQQKQQQEDEQEKESVAAGAGFADYRAMNSSSNSNSSVGSCNNLDLDFPLSDKALQLDILSIVLYARSCMLHAPYMGVYAVSIAEVKRTSVIQRSRISRLRKHSSMRKTFSIDTTLLTTTIITTSNTAVENIVADAKRPSPSKANNNSNTTNNKSNGSAIQTNLSALTVNTDTNASITSFSQSSGDSVATINDLFVPLHLCIGEGCKHYLPLDRVILVIRILLGTSCDNNNENTTNNINSSNSNKSPPLLSSDQMALVYRQLELHSTYLLPNGSMGVPDGKEKTQKISFL